MTRRWTNAASLFDGKHAAEITQSTQSILERFSPVALHWNELRTAFFSHYIFTRASWNKKFWYLFINLENWFCSLAYTGQSRINQRISSDRQHQLTNLHHTIHTTPIPTNCNKRTFYPIIMSTILRRLQGGNLEVVKVDTYLPFPRWLLTIYQIEQQKKKKEKKRKTLLTTHVLTVRNVHSLPHRMDVLLRHQSGGAILRARILAHDWPVA